MKKFLSYKFLMTVLASVVVLLQVLVNVFKVNINIDAVVSITIACVGVMVALGIINKNKDDKTIENTEDLQELLEENKKENNDKEDKNTDN